MLDLIALCGEAHSGKDTVASILSSRLGGTQLQFAGPLKELCHLVFDWNEHHTDGGLKDRPCESSRSSLWWAHARGRAESHAVMDWCEDYDIHRIARTSVARIQTSLILWLDDIQGYIAPRRALQTLGTEWGRRWNPELWIQVAARRVSSLRGVGEIPIVVTDARFPNEGAAVQSWGGQVWRVERSGLDSTLDRTHESEAHIREILADRVIMNDGTLTDLETDVYQILSSMIDTTSEARAI